MVLGRGFRCDLQLFSKVRRILIYFLMSKYNNTCSLLQFKSIKKYIANSNINLCNNCYVKKLHLYKNTSSKSIIICMHIHKILYCYNCNFVNVRDLYFDVLFFAFACFFLFYYYFILYSIV